jgi:dihydropteroate synthase
MIKNTISRSMYTLNCKGKIISLDQPLIMGIINATTDSFYQGDMQLGTDGIAHKVTSMIINGVDIIDIGGQSTRPGSERISPDEEMERVIPVIKTIHERNPAVIISIDTYYAKVAKAAVDAGAAIVNDIGGGMLDPYMIPTVAELGVPYICMHMQGRPENMQDAPYYNDVVKEVLQFFIERIDTCRKAGIRDIIADPGFGFGKNAEHNFTLLRQLAVFRMLEVPVLAGLSRKGTITKTLGVSVDESLNGTTVMNTIALMNGANILRVHDVKEARQVVTLLAAYKKTAQ